ncbi:MAG: hypothetical protein HYX61_08400, partial [Gammaproteobacteria bacterium]|nr:hypothetical protein [Gammaproteobacteria bacterium]
MSSSNKTSLPSKNIETQVKSLDATGPDSIKVSSPVVSGPIDTPDESFFSKLKQSIHSLLSSEVQSNPQDLYDQGQPATSDDNSSNVTEGNDIKDHQVTSTESNPSTDQSEIVGLPDEGHANELFNENGLPIGVDSVPKDLGIGDLTLEEIEKMKKAEAGEIEGGHNSDLMWNPYGLNYIVQSAPQDLGIAPFSSQVEKVFIPVIPVIPVEPERPDNGVLITDLIPKIQGGDAVVDEDDLLAQRGPDESPGSDPTKESTTVEGNFKIQAPDGVGILSVGGVSIIENDVFIPKSIVTPMGNTLDFINYDAGTGTIIYHYTLNDNETHPAGNGENSIFEDFPVHLQDKDNDVANDTLSISIIDDVPTIKPSEVEDKLTVDESDYSQDAKGNFANLFIATPGADGANVHYQLGISSNDADSGLIDSFTNQTVKLYLEAGAIVGRVGGANGDVSFTITLDANTGEVTLNQSRSVIHDDPTDPDEASSPAMLSSGDLITLTAKIIDADFDEDQSTRDIGNAFRFEDDGPYIDLKIVAAADEMIVDESDLSQNASADFADNFSVNTNYGADGPGSSSTAYSLAISANGADSGLIDTQSGQKVILVMNNGVVEGHTEIGNDLVFTVAVNVSGVVTLDQVRAVVHPDGSNPDDSVTLQAANLVQLIRTDTIIDKDLDSVIDTAVLKIGQSLIFKDDGPSIDIKVIATADQLTVDESNLSQNASANFADNFSIVNSNYGADGAGTTSSAYSLSISANGANSGLVDTASSQNVLLVMNNGVVEGRTAVSNELVFTVSVNTSGVVTLDQIRAVVHPDATNPDDAKTLNSDDLIQLTRTDTIIDKDNDTDSDSASLNIGQ